MKCLIFKLNLSIVRIVVLQSFIFIGFIIKEGFFNLIGRNEENVFHDSLDNVAQ